MLLVSRFCSLLTVGVTLVKRGQSRTSVDQAFASCLEIKFTVSSCHQLLPSPGPPPLTIVTTPTSSLPSPALLQYMAPSRWMKPHPVAGLHHGQLRSHGTSVIQPNLSHLLEVPTQHALPLSASRWQPCLPPLRPLSASKRSCKTSRSTWCQMM